MTDSNQPPIIDENNLIEFIKPHSKEELFLNACEYREAVYILTASERATNTVMFRPLFALVGQSIELFLKALLIHYGRDAKSLKGDIAHDISRLLDLAQQNGLMLTAESVHEIESMSTQISKGFFRYGLNEKIPWPTPVPDISKSCAVLDKLINIVAGEIGFHI